MTPAATRESATIFSDQSVTVSTVASRPGVLSTRQNCQKHRRTGDLNMHLVVSDSVSKVASRIPLVGGLDSA